MNDQEWLSCADPKPMLDYLQRTRNASDRKLRLLTVGCWYRYERLSESRADWAATEASEQRAETLSGFSVRELKRTLQELNFAVAFIAGRSLRARKAERAAQAGLVRCVFGNPFRAVPPAPWITNATVSIAQDIYDRRDFAALPMLADLLQKGGCPERAVLDHCRQPDEHVRGCWVVDLILGKS
jgi:hypothetical protein